MGRAANLGGEIRHPGDLAGAAVPPTRRSIRQQFVAAKISDVMVNSPWVWPASETVHFLGLSLSFGVLLAVNLRILGVMRQVPFADVHRLLPWGMLGFGANLITGMLFFVGQPKQYIDSAPFYWKVVFLMIAGANFLYLTVFRKAWTDDALRPVGREPRRQGHGRLVARSRGSPCCTGAGCFRSSATPSNENRRNSGICEFNLRIHLRTEGCDVIC